MVDIADNTEGQNKRRAFRWAYCEFMKDVGMMIKV